MWAGRRRCSGNLSSPKTCHLPFYISGAFFYLFRFHFSQPSRFYLWLLRLFLLFPLNLQNLFPLFVKFLLVGVKKGENEKLALFLRTGEFADDVNEVGANRLLMFFYLTYFLALTLETESKWMEESAFILFSFLSLFVLRFWRLSWLSIFSMSSWLYRIEKKTIS